LAKPTDNLEAYEYVLRARPALQRPERAEVVNARTLFRRAIALDPNYAAAYSGLAETYHLATVMGWAEAPSETLGRAEELANKALHLDESDVRAHIILGRVHVFHQQYEQAKAEMDRAIAVNPNDAHGLAGRGNILMWPEGCPRGVEQGHCGYGRDQVDEMTDQIACDCCKQSVQMVNEIGLCFACDTFQSFATIIKEETDLSDEEALDLAGKLQEHVLSEIIDRLELPGQEHPLVMELLQTMERREKPH
jgi:tetratricopeptide (TPR) repeat protein